MPAPPLPVVGGVEAPVVYPCRYVLGFQQTVHLSCALEQFVLPVALSYAHYYIALAVEVEIWMVVGDIGEIVLRRVVIYQRVVVVGEEITCVVYSAQG